MINVGTINGNSKPFRLLKWAHEFFFVLCAIVFLLTSVCAKAEVNRLGASFTVQQDQDDNYLMSTNNTETLSGSYFKPVIGYSHDDGFEIFSVNAQGSIERFNRSEYNVNNPTYSVNYKRVLERTTLSFGYDAARQSTRISERRDSGNISYTNQQINTTTAEWLYQLNHRNTISINGSMQNTKYESSEYADLKNNGFQLAWQSELGDRLSYYAILSGSNYELTSSGNFYLAPKRIQGYLLCPPNTVLMFETTCYSVTPPKGDAENETTSSGLQTGIKWNIQEQLKFSLGAGVTYLDTVQTIETPEFPVQYGSPIDQYVIFGGERSTINESKLTTTDMSLTYQLETSIYTLSIARKIRPSSTGTLMRSESVDFSMRKSLSEISWIEMNFSAENLLTLENKTVGSSVVDRSVFQSNFKYGYLLSRTLAVTATVGYRYLDANDIKPTQENLFNNEPTVANAVFGVLAISYTPREWAW